MYACVLEAQQTGEQTQMVVSLQRVLAKYEYSAPNGVHLPALLRYGSGFLPNQKLGLTTKAVPRACLFARLIILIPSSKMASMTFANCSKEVDLAREVA